MIGILGAVAPMVKTLFSTIDKTIDNKAEAEKIKQNIQQQLLSGQLKELEAQASIITAEAKRWLASKKLETDAYADICRISCCSLVWVYSS